MAINARSYRGGRKRLTRANFERLIVGQWESVNRDQQRVNGPFLTMVSPGLKHLIIVAGKDQKTISKPTWNLVAKEILVGEYGQTLKG